MHRHINPNLIYIITLISHASADIIVTTLAGSRSYGYADGIGTNASFNNPSDLVFDSSGILIVADRLNNRLRRVTSDGVVTTYAGGGTTTVTDSNGNPASFNNLSGLVFDASGNLFIADLYNNRISKITPSDVFSVFAGNATAGSVDGSGTNATFNLPNSITIDASGNFYVSEWNGNKIRKITSSGVVSTLAGSETIGSADGVGTNATFNRPAAAAADSFGNIFVCDYGNHLIRKITPSGVVTTFAESRAGYADGVRTAAKFNLPSRIIVDSSNNLYVTDRGNHMIRMVTPSGVVSTIAGNGTAGYADGDASTAMFNGSYGITLDSSRNIYVSEINGHRIRVINMGNTPSTTTTTSTTATTTGTADAQFYTSPTKSGNTNLSTTLALSIVIPIAFLVICASAISIYMRFKRIGITLIWYRNWPKFVIYDKKQKNTTPTQDNLLR